MITKENLIQLVSNNTGFSNFGVKTIIESMTEIIKSQVSEGEKITISGFGTFESKQRAKRVGRNPHTGEPVPIPARKQPIFKPSKEFKSRVEEYKSHTEDF